MTDQNDFETILIRDSRLNDISDKIIFPVSVGASNNTYQLFQANSNTPSNLSWTVNPPSESVAVARDVKIKATVEFKLTIGTAATNAGLAAGVNVLQYGLREAFAPFPLNQLINTATISINNMSVNNNLQDTLQALIQMLSIEDLQKYSAGTPTYPEIYARYQDGVLANNNPLGSYSSQSYDNHLVPRGTHPLTLTTVRRYDAGVLQDNSLVSTGVTNHWELECSSTFCEPLFCSPFIFKDGGKNQSAFIGINNFLVNLSLDTTGRRFWSSGLVLGAGVPYTCTISGFTNPYLMFNFLSLDPSFLVPKKTVLPYSDFPRYITGSNLPLLANNASATFTTNSLQLSSVPERIMIYVRKQASSKTVLNPLVQLQIEEVKISFNNKSGIMTNAQKEDLFLTSVDNGLCCTNFYQWSGSVNQYSAPGTPVEVKTQGSLLVLDPVRDFELPPYITNNSIGQYNFQLQIKVTNQLGEDIFPEIVVVCQNSGWITTTSGNSSVTIAPLNMQSVTQAINSSQQTYSMSEYKRMVGGRFAGVMNQTLKKLDSVGKGGSSYSGGKGGSAYSGGSKLSSLVM